MIQGKAWRLVLADDHRLVRAGLRSLIEEFDGFEVVGEADDGQEAIDLVERHQPDIAVIDISMPKFNGFEALPRIRHVSPDSRVLVVSMHDESEFVMRALQAGAHGYVVKDSAATELHMALEALLQGHRFLSPSVQRPVIDQAISDKPLHTPFQHDAQAIVPLTPRQIDVLTRLASGASMKEIAYELGLSVKTVETHRAQIMERLHIHDVPRLVLYAARHGLVRLEDM